MRSLEWLGATRAALVGSHQVQWESDPWSRGGYAIFDPAFPPAMRDWLSRPAGRLFFAGEHTSGQWQGYMNGAAQSGADAALAVMAKVSGSAVAPPKAARRYTRRQLVRL